MTKERLLSFLNLVDRARQGDEAAKAALLVILETERKPAILRKLSLGDVRPQDRGDAHHNVLMQVGRKIVHLRSTRAYFKWEERIISQECRKWRREYRLLVEPVETTLAKMEGTY